MSRCDHCAYRNSWDCDDGWNRADNNTFCSDFKLDFDSLSSEQKNSIQRILMNKDRDEDRYDYYD